MTWCAWLGLGLAIGFGLGVPLGFAALSLCVMAGRRSSHDL